MVTRLTRRKLDSLLAFIIAMCITVPIVVGGWYTRDAISTEEHRWCATLVLLTKHTVPKPKNPKANQSRENVYVFYTNLLKLRRGFGC